MPPGGIYAATVTGELSPKVAGLPPRVYVPNETTGEVVVIDPVSFRVIRRIVVGRLPQHISPDWDLSRLFVTNMNSGTLTVIDPVRERPVGTIRVAAPYNLYFTLDGKRAIVVNDYRVARSASRNGLSFYDRRSWRLIRFLPIPWMGADHLDMSADGRTLLVSTEFSGRVVKVDLQQMRIAGSVIVGGLPVDVRLAPDGSVFYAANQGRDGVSIIDPRRMKEIGFVRTGRGAHGLAISRDATRLYVTNRYAGTISVIEFSTRRVVATWRVGGTPDMISVSPNGRQLWVSNRYRGTVSVVDARTGRTLRTIPVGINPHGLVYWPQPGRLSLGHNGVMR